MADKELEERAAQEEYKTKWIEAEYKTLGWKSPEEEAYDAGMKDGAAEAARANSRLKQAVDQAKVEAYQTGFDDGQNYSFTANQLVEQIKGQARIEGTCDILNILIWKVPTTWKPINWVAELQNNEVEIAWNDKTEKFEALKQGKEVKK